MRKNDLALFLMLGQSADRVVRKSPDIAPPQSLDISNNFDLSDSLPVSVWRSVRAAETYKLLFVFEEYLRELVVSSLTEAFSEAWWDKIPTDVQEYVSGLEQTEETKRWMAIGSRDKSALLTLPQLVRVIDVNWKVTFEPVLRDRALLNEARTIVHLRNTICHMSEVSDEEHERIKMVMRDWFRIVAP